jgi:hypothetical protein
MLITLSSYKCLENSGCRAFKLLGTLIYILILNKVSALA